MTFVCLGYKTNICSNAKLKTNLMCTCVFILVKFGASLLHSTAALAPWESVAVIYK